MDKLPVKYNVEEAALVEIESYKDLKIQGIHDKGGLALVHASRIKCKTTRCAIESYRKELNADAVDYKRRVDAEAKRLTSRITPVEDYLSAEEKRITDEIDRIKREKAEAEAKRIEARMAAFHKAEGAITLTEARDWTDEEFYLHLGEAEAEKAERDKARAEAEAAREAEEAKRQAEAKAEYERLKSERVKIEAEKAEIAAAKAKADAEAKAEKDRVERERKAEADRIAAERKKIEDERRAFEAEKKAEQDRKDREAAIAKAKEQAVPLRLSCFIHGDYIGDECPGCLGMREDVATEAKASRHVGPFQIRFDGPPGPEAGRFVEAETLDGKSINIGEWRQDGEYWLLVIDPHKYI